MTLIKALISEYKNEMANTRKILSLVPIDNKTYKPHAKSMEMGRLAKHLAELPTWVGVTINQDELDFAKEYPKTPNPENTEALLKMMDDNLSAAIKVLESTPEEKLNEPWTMRNGDHIFFTMPKGIVLRNFVFNHNIHHRAQLGVYLRLLDIPIPGIYGPSADESGI